jgi:membrane protein YqaA with SNARE-associated domain
MEQNSGSPVLEKEAKKIDKWIAYIAAHAWARTIVFIAAFLEGIISPVPPEIVVAAVLSYRKDISWKILSLTSALGSAAGLSVLYLLGKYAYKTHQAFFAGVLNASSFGTYAERLFSHNIFVSMFLSTFTPLLDRVFALLAGIFLLSLPLVLVGFFLGRLVRVGIVAYFSYHLGAEARGYIIKHTRTASVIVVVLLLLYIAFKHFGIL